MRILVLEDDENRIKWFRQNLIGNVVDFTKDPKEANKWLEEKEYGMIFLDCDLEPEHYNNKAWVEGNFKQFEESSGIAVAKFLADNPTLNSNSRIIIHSLNPNGAEVMSRLCFSRNPLCINYLYLKTEMGKILKGSH